MRILNLTIKAKYFTEILQGIKKEEYRQVKKHWIARLCGSKSVVGINFDCVHEFYPKSYEKVKFINGYGNTSPSFTIECKGIDLKKDIETPLGKGDFFVIKLGKILETENLKDN